MTNPQVMAGEIFARLADALETGTFGAQATVALTTLGSELGPEELVRGAEMAVAQDPGLKVILIGPRVETELPVMECACEADAHRIMEELLPRAKPTPPSPCTTTSPGRVHRGRVVTPARASPCSLPPPPAPRHLTGWRPWSQRRRRHCRGQVYGDSRPRLGVLNGRARQVERILKTWLPRVISIEFSQSVRSDGGSGVAGQRPLTGSADVVVCDTLTGNLLMKLFSAFTSGGTYETLGWGYGPGVGAGFAKIINIISRASGAPVVAGAIQYAASCSKGNLPHVAQAEFQAAERAGLAALLTKTEKPQVQELAPPPRKPVTEEIAGIDILELENAVGALWAENIYAETGMGCAGPVILVAPADAEKARAILAGKNYI